MLWRFFHRDRWDDHGARVRRMHEQWLTKAIASGRSFPKIPLRRVADGGFAPMLSRPTGPDRAERWWNLALDRVDLDL